MKYGFMGSHSVENTENIQETRNIESEPEISEEMEAEENYDDCRLEQDAGEGKISETGEETEDDDEDYDACVKEAVEEKAEEEQEEAEEIQEKVEKDTNSLEEEDAEKKIDEKSLDREAVAERAEEKIEEESGEQLEEPQKEELREELSEELEEKAEDGQIEAGAVKEAVEEKAEEEQEEAKEEAEEIQEKVEKDTNSLEEEDAEKKIDEKSLDREAVAERAEEKIEEESGEQLEEPQKEELREELSEELEEKAEDGQIEARAVEEAVEQKSIDVRIREILDSDEAVYADAESLKKDSRKYLDYVEAEKEELAAASREKFQEAMACEPKTDGYRKALKEYNDIHEQYEQKTAEVSEFRRQQEALEKKTVELRQQQIEKGEAAAEASAETLEVSEKLQEQYEEEIYSRKPNADNLETIQIKNTDAIRVLSAQRESIRQTLDAKMAEISEYVMNRNLERYETEHDSYYQRLISEYRSMQDSYRRIDYHIVKLDENNIGIAEITGRPYESVRYPNKPSIKETAEGTDIPGETDYFIDETRAGQVFSGFRQDRWEKLTIDEQKEAMEKLADYNADILGIDVKPAIRYYHAEDPSDYGGFSQKENTIYINEYMIGNAAEAADTISHEYRHCYQHMRAEKLENERDLEYRDNFENYIRPEDDYVSYKKQLVEADAESYAQAVCKKIAEINEENEEHTAAEGKPSRTFKENDAERRQMKEAVPEGLERKRKEIDRLKETFEGEELQELKEHVRGTYENCMKIADRIEAFNSYKEHYRLEGGHIEKVHDKSLQAAESLEKLLVSTDYDELYSPEIDRKALQLMALYHDTGMDGNIDFSEYEATRERDKTGDFETQLRKKHSVQSAVHALRDRQFIEGKTVSADRVAIGCLLHSKSNSDVKNLADPAEWECAVDRLKKAVADFNEVHPEERIFFDDSFLRDENGALSKSELSKLRSECLCLRIGDANGHDYESRTSQNGKAIDFSLRDWKQTEATMSDKLQKQIIFAESSGILMEVGKAKVSIDGKILEKADDPEGIARAFALGEGNLKGLEFLPYGDGVVEEVTLVDADAYPLSTQFCIEERLKEFNTACICENEPVTRYEGMRDEDYKKMMEEMQNQLPKMNIRTCIRLGEASERTIKSYQMFAAKMKTNYGLQVEVKI